MKKYLILTAVILLNLSMSCLSAKDKTEFRFNKNGQFKVAQFTDVHWDNNDKANCIKTKESMMHVLLAEKPDIAIITGDVVWRDDIKGGWTAIAKIFEEAKTPWAVTLGNHDSEEDITREEIFEFIKDFPYFAGEKGPTLHGSGNYAIPVLGSKSDAPSAVLYCIDSNDYPPTHRTGHYDWIKFPQIEWYRNTSDQFTSNNNGTPLPSLAFFHIPLIEYNNIVGKEKTIGEKKEGIASPELNSGLFCSMVEKRDIMGVFVGHDHNNNYIGIDHDIALAFGQVSGWSAYGLFERGARIILMYEDRFQFDSWISTKNGTEFLYYYPSGLSLHEEQTADYLPAQNVNPKHQGIDYTYFEGRFRSTDQIVSAKPIKKGTLKNVSLEPALAKDSMAFEYKAWIKIPEKGIYNFYTYSDDGSRLYIDGKLVVDNDGSHSAKFASGKVALEAGYHDFKLLYFEDYMGEQLEVGLSSRSIREDKIPDNMLFRKE